MSLHDKLVKARKKYREYKKEKKGTKPGSARRKKLARRVRYWRDRIEFLKKKNVKPDWNGHTPVLGATGVKLVLWANSLGLYVTSTNDGSHSPTSYHSVNRAIDFGFLDTGETNNALKFQNELARDATHYAEVFGPDNAAFVKNGTRFTIREGDPLENQHDNHVHVAV